MSKSCVTCRFAVFAYPADPNPRCMSPHVVPWPNPVTGDLEGLWRSCYLQREDGRLLSIVFRRCGKRGRFWQPREAE
jgi:hypothetical protein